MERQWRHGFCEEFVQPPCGAFGGSGTCDNRSMPSASATVIGTDGHRRLCRDEGVAYMETFGPPLIFLTPNVADTQHPFGCFR